MKIEKAKSGQTVLGEAGRFGGFVPDFNCCTE